MPLVRSMICVGMMKSAALAQHQEALLTKLSEPI